MSDSLKCEIVRDLLPSFLDGLTSDVSNNEIEKHLSSCDECSSMLEKMKIPMESTMPTKEMDYLKKIKLHSNRNMIMGIVVTILLLLSITCIKCYVIGFQSKGISDYELLYSPVQADKEKFCLVVQGQLENSSMVYKDYDVRIDGDKAYITLSERMAYPAEDNNDFYVGYEIPESINTVYLYDNTIWENSTLITKEVNDLYKTKHPYIGDMSANASVVGALKLADKLGNFKNSLQTKTEPYGWTLEFENMITKEDLFNSRMTQYGYVMLSLIDNLSEISWSYDNGTEIVTKTVTLDDAKNVMGKDIKKYSQSISQFQTLADALYIY